MGHPPQGCVWRQLASLACGAWRNSARSLPQCGLHLVQARGPRDRPSRAGGLGASPRPVWLGCRGRHSGPLPRGGHTPLRTRHGAAMEGLLPAPCMWLHLGGASRPKAPWCGSPAAAASRTLWAKCGSASAWLARVRVSVSLRVVCCASHVACDPCACARSVCTAPSLGVREGWASEVADCCQPPPHSHPLLPTAGLRFSPSAPMLGTWRIDRRIVDLRWTPRPQEQLLAKCHHQIVMSRAYLICSCGCR